MIEKSSVIATENSFVTADKVNVQQKIKGFGKLTKLQNIKDFRSTGLFIETKHFSIVVSPQQKFIISNSEYALADTLVVGDQVMTAEGFEEIVGIIKLDGVHEMSSLSTEQNAFYANSFLLLVD